MTELVVIIPVYNESEIIKEVLEDWVQTLNTLQIKYKIKLYNDGSIDSTQFILNNLQLEYQDTVDVIHKENSGHGPTILLGYISNIETQWIFQVDADNEIPAKYFPNFWNIKNEYDIVIANRGKRGNGFIRRLMSFMSYLIVRIIYGKGIKDVNAPYRLIRTKKKKKIIKDIPENTFAPNIIISGMANKKKLRIKIFDLASAERKTGSPSLGNKLFKLLRISFRSFKEIVIYGLSK